MTEEELIETLRAFENKRVEQLEEPTRNLFYAIMKIADERDKYKTIINKAIEYMKDNSKISLDDTISIINFYRQLLDILKGNDKE